MTAINAYVIPSGGAIGMQLNGSGNWTLARAVSGATGLGTFTPIGSGTFSVSGQAFFFLDAGEALPGPLAASGMYVYQFTDGTSTVTSPTLTPVASVTLDPDPIADALIRLIQGFINSLTLPGKGPRPQVTSAMPLQGWPPLPLIVVYEELLQQAEVPIGRDVPNPDKTNTWVSSELAQRAFRISILCLTPGERKFYRDAIIGFFKVGLAYVLSQIGQDVRQEYQASSYQVTGDNQSLSPGFYGCDIVLGITGMFNVVVTTSYGVIHTITGTAGTSEDGFQGVQSTIAVQVTG